MGEPLKHNVRLLLLCEGMNRRSPVFRASSLLTLLWACSVVAVSQYKAQDHVVRHLKEDQEWARKTGLSSAAVRKLRLLTEVSDDSDTLIDKLDARSLRSRNQILLVTTSGNGNCLDLYIFKRGNSDYRLIWSATEMPGGAGYCRASSYNPEASARAGKIVVKIPVFDYRRGVPQASDFYTYVWDGKIYRYAAKWPARVRAGERRVTSKRAI